MSSAEAKVPVTLVLKHVHSMHKVIIFSVITLEPTIQSGQGICNVGLAWSVNNFKAVNLNAKDPSFHTGRGLRFLRIDVLQKLMIRLKLKLLPNDIHVKALTSPYQG